MTKWSKWREHSSTRMACREGVWSVTWSSHPASTICMALPAFRVSATFCLSWMKLETKTKLIVKYPSLGSAFWLQLIFSLLMNNLFVSRPSLPSCKRLLSTRVGMDNLGVRLSVFYRDKIKVRDWIPHIGHLPKVIPLKLFLDIVPCSSEDFTRAMREQTKHQQQQQRQQQPFIYTWETRSNAGKYDD